MTMLRGLIQSLSWLSGKIRTFSGIGLPGQNLRNRELMQHYGFTSNPPAGSNIVMLKNGNAIVSVAEDHPTSRPDLDQLDGAACLWMDADHYVLVKIDGSIKIKTDQSVTIDAPSIKIGGAILTQKLPTYLFATAVCTALAALTGGTFPATPEAIEGALTENTEAK
jgi:phage gp45-like